MDNIALDYHQTMFVCAKYICIFRNTTSKVLSTWILSIADCCMKRFWFYCFAGWVNNIFESVGQHQEILFSSIWMMNDIQNLQIYTENILYARNGLRWRGNLKISHRFNEYVRSKLILWVEFNWTIFEAFNVFEWCNHGWK